ncbi:amino acid deaminase [Amycolatopsis acidicola]|uniref:Amino acid deaminase n=1 Tax=Amycolatopsis acidicola TaxID=2596893 RepID=A0A5N0VIE1_9PSEU|nr:alanine racemase [Amycolatopsis acidicola]KAA9164930.1 amino acid deaminase [Amycolatopsis acidicola]
MRPLRLPDARISARHKGFPPSMFGTTGAGVVGRSGILDFLTPLLLLGQEPLRHNLLTLQQFCAGRGLSSAPHVKTTMSPEIVNAQIEHGAWAVTVATPSQAIALRELGAERILLANELVEPHAIDWLAAEMADDPNFTCYCYVDSADGLDILEKRLDGCRRPFPVLIELGIPGGRTGVRDSAHALAFAERVAASPVLELAGVGGFEGVIGGELGPRLLEEVRAYLRRLRALADETLSGSEFIVTVGGSAFIELVGEILGPEWQAGRPVRVVLRSGCYVTHDSLGYQRFRDLVGAEYEALRFQPSLELWASVLSCPEPGLAIVDFGKRDTGLDSGFPVPLHRLRRGSTEIEPAPPGEVFACNDQHAYFRGGLEVGDRVGFGISHPCTTFDKWRLFPIVDKEYRVLGTAQTMF